MTTAKNEDNVKNQDNLKKWWGWWINFPYYISSTLKVSNGSVSIEYWNYSGLVRVDPAQSNSDYKAFSASQQS